MNGFIKKTAAAVCLGSAVALSGCCKDCANTTGDCYDHCWLERNSFQSRMSVQQTFGAQVYNGHVLDQTVFAYHFEPGTDILTKGGQEHLAYLARRRPCPDTHIYLQTAQDVAYDPAAPEQYNKIRTELDAKRVTAIQRFLAADTAGRPVAFDVAVHDAPTPGLPALPIGNAMGRHYNSFPGTIGGAGAAISGGPTGTTAGSAGMPR
jgi:hypothetical protein